jgi:NadR type nicotinamide-nucleotide adenylyltransferase
MDSVKKIAITGPESTGKSTLARKLAEHYKTLWVPEYARTYIDQLDRPYEQHDLNQIAKGQIFHENEFISKSNKFMFCDTELTVLKIWSAYKYGNVDSYILSEYKNSSYDLYLLLDIDLPWEYDSQRENPDQRKYFFDWFEKELRLKGANYQIINGNADERLENACRAIEHYFYK